MSAREVVRPLGADRLAIIRWLADAAWCPDCWTVLAVVLPKVSRDMWTGESGTHVCCGTCGQWWHARFLPPVGPDEWGRPLRADGAPLELTRATPPPEWRAPQRA